MQYFWLRCIWPVFAYADQHTMLMPGFDNYHWSLFLEVHLLLPLSQQPLICQGIPTMTIIINAWKSHQGQWIEIWGLQFKRGHHGFWQWLGWVTRPSNLFRYLQVMDLILYYQLIILEVIAGRFVIQILSLTDPLMHHVSSHILSSR